MNQIIWSQDKEKYVDENVIILRAKDLVLKQVEAEKDKLHDHVVHEYTLDTGKTISGTLTMTRTSLVPKSKGNYTLLIGLRKCATI